MLRMDSSQCLLSHQKWWLDVIVLFYNSQSLYNLFEDGRQISGMCYWREFLIFVVGESD